MNINDLYPSKYISASDLQGRDVEVTIANVAIEEVGKENEKRPILYFQGKQKGIVLNKTNAHNVGAIYGPDTNGWIGQRVTLFVAWVDFQGKSVEAIRIRAPRPQPTGNTPPEQEQAPAPSNHQMAGYDDEIPF